MSDENKPVTKEDIRAVLLTAIFATFFGIAILIGWGWAFLFLGAWCTAMTIRLWSKYIAQK